MPLHAVVDPRQHPLAIRRRQKVRALLIQITALPCPRDQPARSIRPQSRDIMLREAPSFPLPLLWIIRRHIDDLRHAKTRRRRQTPRRAAGLAAATGEEKNERKKEILHVQETRQQPQSAKHSTFPATLTAAVAQSPQTRCGAPGGGVHSSNARRNEAAGAATTMHHRLWRCKAPLCVFRGIVLCSRHAIGPADACQAALAVRHCPHRHHPGASAPSASTPGIPPAAAHAAYHLSHSTAPILAPRCVP